MLSFRYLLIMFIIVCATPLLADMSANWFTCYGSTGHESVTASCYDPDGNYYLAGEFRGSFQMNDTTLNAGIHSTAFIAKYSATGQFIWARQSTSSGATSRSAFVTGIVADADQNVYLCGSFDGLFKLSDISVTSNSYVDSYIARLDATGACQWITRGNAGATNKAYAIALSSDNLPLVCGSFSSNTNLFGTAVTNSGLEDAYLAKFNTTGTINTLKHWGSISNDQCQSISPLSSGEIVITGFYSNAISFSGTSLPAHNVEVFVCKLDASLNPIWVKGSISDGWNQNDNIVTANDSGIYVFGRYNAGMSWDAFSLANTGYSLYALKLDNSGNVVWLSNLLSSSSGRSIKGACLTSDSTIVLSGFYSESCTTSLGTITGAGSDDAFVMLVSSAGSLEMFQTLGGSGLDASFTLSINADDELLCAGYYSASDSNFMGTIPVYSGLKDIFALRFNLQDSSIPAAPQNIMLHNNDQQLSLSWSSVHTSQSGTPISVSGYQIYGSSSFEEDSFELIGECVGTTYLLPINELSYSHRFYIVKAVP